MPRIQPDQVLHSQLEARGITEKTGVFGKHKVQLGKSDPIRLDSIKANKVPFQGFTTATKIVRGKEGLTKSAHDALQVLKEPGTLKAKNLLGCLKAAQDYMTRLDKLGQLSEQQKESPLWAFAPAVENLSNAELAAVYQAFTTADMDLLQSALLREGQINAKAGDARSAASMLFDLQALVLKEVSNRTVRGMVDDLVAAHPEGSSLTALRMPPRLSEEYGAQGAAIIRLVERTAAATAVNEKQAKALGLDYDRVITFSPSHAGYYPGAQNMTIKTLFERSTGRLLGAQIVGFDGADKRIDVLACAMRAGLTGEELQEMDLAYAPPYSSAKDPVNMAGYVIGNVRSGLVEQYHWEEVDGLAEREDVILLDVRTEAEYRNGHIPGAVNIPLDELRGRLEELDREKTLYVNCQSGLRSYLACRILSQNGFSCRNLSGGYRFYEYVKKDRAFDASPAGPCGVPLQKG